MKTIHLIILLSLSIGCSETEKTKEQIQLGINFIIVPENDIGGYHVEWKDTLGLSQNYGTHQRPLELWCIVKNEENDTLGYYKGLSTPQRFTYFITQDSIVYLEFKRAANFWSDMYHGKSEKENKKLWEKNAKIIDFDPVSVNIKKDLRKEFEVVLKEKTDP
jgi:hypothetical protein